MRDCLAFRVEEGRSYWRYALGSKKQAMIQRSPNGTTYEYNVYAEVYIKFMWTTRRTETS